MKNINYHAIIVILFNIIFCIDTLAQPSQEKPFDRSLFLNQPIKEQAFQTLNENEMSKLSTKILPDSFTTEDVLLTTREIKATTDKIANTLEKNFFTKSHLFWSDWDTSKLQILLITPSSDFAYLLNNQNPDVDKIGARIEYSARTLLDNKIKVNAFGKTKLNGIDTYFYNIDAYSQLDEMTNLDFFYDMHLTTLIHEAVHILKQGGAKSVDQIDYSNTMRGITFPIDITSRYYRNEVHHFLSLAARAKTKQQAMRYVRSAMYFHQLYLKENITNKKHNNYDLVEGMALYITNAVTAVINADNSNIKDIHNTAKINTVDFAEFEFNYAEQQEHQVLNWGREYYDIGGLAYAVAIALGHQEIMHYSKSPLQFLSEHYPAIKTNDTTVLKKIVYDFYNAKQTLHNKQHAEINRVLSNPNNILIAFNEDDSGSMTIESDSILYNYKSQQGSFEIRSQEIEFADNRFKLSLQHTLSTMTNELDEQGFPIMQLIIPVNKKDIEFQNDRLTIQSETLIMFDVKFKQDGDMYWLIKN